MTATGGDAAGKGKVDNTFERLFLHEQALLFVADAGEFRLGEAAPPAGAKVEEGAAVTPEVRDADAAAPNSEELPKPGKDDDLLRKPPEAVEARRKEALKWVLPPDDANLEQSSANSEGLERGSVSDDGWEGEPLSPKDWVAWWNDQAADFE